MARAACRYAVPGEAEQPAHDDGQEVDAAAGARAQRVHEDDP